MDKKLIKIVQEYNNRNIIFTISMEFKRKQIIIFLTIC